MKVKPLIVNQLLRSFRLSPYNHSRSNIVCHAEYLFIYSSHKCADIVSKNCFEGIKARSHDRILRIRILVPKIGRRGSDGPISRFRFCGENVGRSFVVCSHDPIFRTEIESSIWRQNDHRDIMQNLLAPFIFYKRVSDENRACSISIRFFQNYGSMCQKVIFNVFTRIRFSEPTKIGSLETDVVNGL